MTIYLQVIHFHLQVQALNSECTVKSSSSLIGDRFFQLAPQSSKHTPTMPVLFTQQSCFSIQMDITKFV